MSRRRAGKAQANLGSPDSGSEVKRTDSCSNPDPGLTETLVGSRSPVALPRRGTRPRKQSGRYTPVRRLQVLPVHQAQVRPTVWLFPTLGVAITLTSCSPLFLLTPWGIHKPRQIPPGLGLKCDLAHTERGTDSVSPNSGQEILTSPQRDDGPSNLCCRHYPTRPY